MMTRRVSFTAGVILSVMALLYSVERIHAQSVGLSISPPVVELILAPNKKVIQSVTIKNQGETAEFAVNIHKITPAGNEGHVEIEVSPLDPASIPLVVSLGNADIAFNVPFSIKGGESRQIVLSIEGANVDAVEDTYLALVVKPVTPAGVKPTSSAGISSFILTTLTPSDTIPLNIEIADLSLPYIHDSMIPLSINGTFKNSTPVMIRPEGKVELISPAGRTMQEIGIYPHLVLGDSSRSLFMKTIGDTPQPAPLIISTSPFTLGPHKIRLTALTVGGTRLDELEATVWFFPIRATIALCMLLLIGMVVRVRTRHKNVQSGDLDSDM